MCNGGSSPGGATEALGMLDRALACLASADVAALPSAVQAEALRALGRAEARHTAARARMLTAFAAQGGYEDGGHGTARTWLKWQTRVTTGAAAGAIGWVRRPTAVLEALGKKAGPEDIRTSGQRRHDALEEACRRLIRSGMLPGRGGQPTQVLVHMTLGQLRGITGAGAGNPGGSAAEDARAAARASQPGWVTGPEADAAVCDATLVPIVTGHVDWAALERLADIVLAITTSPAAGPVPPNPHSGPAAAPRPPPATHTAPSPAATSPPACATSTT